MGTLKRKVFLFAFMEDEEKKDLGEMISHLKGVARINENMYVSDCTHVVVPDELDTTEKWCPKMLGALGSGNKFIVKSSFIKESFLRCQFLNEADYLPAVIKLNVQRIQVSGRPFKNYKCIVILSMPRRQAELKSILRDSGATVFNWTISDLRFKSSQEVAPLQYVFSDLKLTNNRRFEEFLTMRAKQNHNIKVLSYYMIYKVITSPPLDAEERRLLEIQFDVKNKVFMERLHGKQMVSATIDIDTAPRPETIRQVKQPPPEITLDSSDEEPDDEVQALPGPKHDDIEILDAPKIKKDDKPLPKFDAPKIKKEDKPLPKYAPAMIYKIKKEEKPSFSKYSPAMIQPPMKRPKREQMTEDIEYVFDKKPEVISLDSSDEETEVVTLTQTTSQLSSENPLNGKWDNETEISLQTNDTEKTVIEDVGASLPMENSLQTNDLMIEDTETLSCEKTVTENDDASQPESDEPMSEGNDETSTTDDNSANEKDTGPTCSSTLGALNIDRSVALPQQSDSDSEPEESEPLVPISKPKTPQKTKRVLEEIDMFQTAATSEASSDNEMDVDKSSLSPFAPEDLTPALMNKYIDTHMRSGWDVCDGRVKTPKFDLVKECKTFKRKDNKYFDARLENPISAPICKDDLETILGLDEDDKDKNSLSMLANELEISNSLLSSRHFLPAPLLSKLLTNLRQRTKSSKQASPGLALIQHQFLEILWLQLRLHPLKTNMVQRQLYKDLFEGNLPKFVHGLVEDILAQRKHFYIDLLNFVVDVLTKDISYWRDYEIKKERPLVSAYISYMQNKTSSEKGIGPMGQLLTDLSTCDKIPYVQELLLRVFSMAAAYWSCKDKDNLKSKDCIQRTIANKYLKYMVKDEEITMKVGEFFNSL